MKKGLSFLIAVVILTALVPLGSAAEKREAQPPLTVEMLAAALNLSYRCYDLKPVAGSEKKLYLEVVTKEGVIFSREMMWMKGEYPAPKSLAVLIQKEEDNLQFTCICCDNGVLLGNSKFSIKNYMAGMSTFHSNSGMFKLGEFFLYGANPMTGITMNGSKLDELQGEIGFRIVAK